LGLFRRKSSTALALGAALAMFASGAFAQDGSEADIQRTPAGANAFLNDFLGRNRAIASVHVTMPNMYGRSEAKRWRGWYLTPEGEAQSTNQSLAEARVVAVNADNPCVSTLKLTNFHYHGTTGGNVDPYDVVLGADGPITDYHLDWSKITTLILPDLPNSGLNPGYVIVLYSKNPNTNVYFTLATLADAKRARFAMEFLRVACVSKSTTGF
jgi:hypothetical protein